MNDGSGAPPLDSDPGIRIALPETATPPAPRAPRTIGTVVAWLVILGLTTFVALGTAMVDADPAAAENMAALQYRMQVRNEYGMQGVLPGIEKSMSVSGGVQTGPPAVRLRNAVVLADRDGPARALEALDELRTLLAAEGRTLDGRDAETGAALRTLYGSPDGSPAPRHDAAAVERLGEAERELLRQHLDWFGELALAPDDGPTLVARRTLLDAATSSILSLLAAFAVLLLLGLTGLVGLVLFFLGVHRDRIVLALRPTPTLGGILAETFAVWLVLFLGLSFTAGALAPAEHVLLAGGGAMLLSLGALAWPMLRGRPWTEVREAIGLIAPRNPLVEIGCGFASWWINLPVLAVGFLLTLVLGVVATAFAGPVGPLDSVTGPSHPIQEPLSKGGGLVWIVLLACVVAPVVEEIFFRGVLYGHLRAASSRWPREASIFASGLLCGVLFAAVHPQGWIAIPLLTSVSFALVHAREWRGGLLAPMATHALHNGMALLLASQVL